MNLALKSRYHLSPLHLILLLAFMQLAIALFSGGFSLSFDESMWQYIGRNWFRHGLVPYTGGVDNKSPLIFAVFGISDKLFGVNYWFPRLMGTLSQTLGLYFVFRIARAKAGVNAAILAVSFYGLALLWHSTGSKYVAFTESYAVTLMIISFYFHFIGNEPKQSFLSGLFAGLAFCFRLSAFFGMFAIFISSIRRSRLAFLQFVLGVLLSVLTVAALLLAAGMHMHELLTYALLDNFGAGSPTDHSLLWKIEGLTSRFFATDMMLFLPGVIGYLLLRKKIDVLSGWLICEFIGVNVIGMYSQQHFKNMLPALSLLSAFSLAALIEKYRLPMKPILIISWISFFPKSVEPLAGMKKWIFPPATDPAMYCQDKDRRPDEEAQKILGRWIRGQTSDTDRVFVAGYGAVVQAYSERISPSIYFNVTQTKRAKERFMDDLQSSKPAMVALPASAEYEKIIAQDLRTFVDRILLANYHFERCLYGYQIYRINR